VKGVYPPMARHAFSKGGRSCAAFPSLLVLLGLLGAGPAGDLAAEEDLPRAARSVHLAWQCPAADVFVLEVSVERTVPGSYFMVCGWQVGYFGLQELADGRRVLLFSVWDDAQGDDPAAVPADRRVEVVSHAEGVRIRRFGGEGTGGQAMMDFPWRTNVPYRFLVRARVEGERTRYAGWVSDPETGKWRHVVTFRTRTGGQSMTGLYSFLEDFRRDGRSAAEERRACFGSGWIRELSGSWRALTRARFTASGAPWEARDSIRAEVRHRDTFVLATGGKVRPELPPGSVLEIRPPGGNPPRDLPEEF